MATGTPEEAGNWVEYCNGTGETYYANLRRKDGYPEPFNGKFWGIGNEEKAEPDCGKDQNPDDYVKDTWQFIKLMKLNDPNIKIVLAGEYDLHWTKTVLDGLNTVCDFISLHYYVRSADYLSLFERVEGLENALTRMDSLIKIYPQKVETFNKWYRFPPRQEPIKISLDEWGFWESEGTGVYNLEVGYEWRHALGTAIFLNIMMRNADKIGMATWAQTVNILAPIMTGKEGSICQTVFYPLEYFRKYCGGITLKIKVESPLIDRNINSLDATASYDSKQNILTFTIINKNQTESIETAIQLKNRNIQKGVKIIRLTADSVNAKNQLGKKSIDVVKINETEKIPDKNKLIIPPASIVIYQCKIEK